MRIGPLLVLAGCAMSLSCLHSAPWLSAPREIVVVPARGEGEGVVYRRRTFRESTVELLDVDLSTPGVQVRVHARRPVPGGGAWSVGDAFTLPVWCRLTGALGGVNGGFFGEEIEPGRKEVIGLLKLNGRVHAPAALYRSRSNRTVTYAHSAFGLSVDGRPLIDWVVSDRRDRRRLLAYPRPERLRDGRPWPTWWAVAGGPRLIHRGRIDVADRRERLASPGSLPRTFIGYASTPSGKPRLVLGAAAAFSFRDAAEFLAEYFRRECGFTCEEAMCLDGGPSSQLAYRHGARITSPLGVGVPVPTCVLVHASDIGGR